MTIFHVIKYPTTLPLKISSLPKEVADAWAERVSVYRYDVVRKMSHDNVTHLNQLYMMSSQTNAYEIVKACLESIVAAAELTDWANLEMDFDTLEERKLATMKAESAKFVVWLNEELLKYEGPL